MGSSSHQKSSRAVSFKRTLRKRFRSRSLACLAKPDFQPFQNEKAEPLDHAMAYARVITFPDWPFREKISFNEAEKLKKKAHKKLTAKKILAHFETIQCGDFFISHCTSKNIKNLFFGKTSHAVENGLINQI